MNLIKNTIFLLFIFLSLGSKAQFYEVKRYDMKDGMKSDYINHVYYDKKGFIWITDGSFGVTRFDGKTFKNFNDKETDIIVKANFVEIDNKMRFISNGFMYEILNDSITWKVGIDAKAYTKENGDKSAIALRQGFLDRWGTMWMTPDKSRIYAFNGTKTMEILKANRASYLELNNQSQCYYEEEVGDYKILHFLELNNNAIDIKNYNISKDELYLGSLDKDIYTWLNSPEGWILTIYHDGQKKQILIDKADYQSMNNDRFIVHNNRAYLCTYNSIIEFTANAYKVYVFEGKDLMDAPPVIYNDGILYGNMFFDGKRVRNIFPIPFLPKGDLSFVSSVITDNENNIWYATYNGLYKASVTPIRKIPYSASYYAGIDRQGNQFIFSRRIKNNAYSTDSLMIVDPNFKPVKSIQFSAEPANLSLDEHNGNIYFVSSDLNTFCVLDHSYSQKTYKINKSMLRNYSTTKTENYFDNYSLVFSSRQGIFYFVNNNHLVILMDGQLKLIALPGQYKASEFVRLLLTKNDELYLCFKDQILKYTNGKFLTVSSKNIKPALTNYNAFLNSKDSTGIMLFPKDTVRMVYFYQNDVFKEYKIENDTTFSFSQNTTNTIRNYFWVQNSLLIPCEGVGILRLDFNFNTHKFKLEAVGKLQGLPSTKLSSFCLDKHENLWFFNNISRNIIRYSLDSFMARKYADYTEFIGSPIAGFPTAKMDKNGLIYMAVDEGIISIDPNNVKHHPFKNRPFVEQMLIIKGDAFIEQSLINSIELPYKSNILFKYNVIKFNDNEKLRFSTRLDGLNSDWQPETDNRSVTYNNLPSGTYKLHIRVRLNGKWIESNTPVYFIVLKPFWQKWWFIACFIIALILLIRFYLKYREKSLVEKQKQLEQKIDAATVEIKSQKHLIEEKHKEITDSINYAERIQKSFMTTEKNLSKHLKDYFILFNPKDVVSGDFYWSTVLNDGTFAFVVADSTGHGVPGAIMSLLNITSLETVAKKGLTDAGQILDETRDIIIERLKHDGSEEGGKDGMDAVICCFDFANYKLRYAAANNPLWIVRNNELIEYKPDKMPVGKAMGDIKPFTSHEIALQKGDLIIMITDGFADQFGGNRGKKFMYKPLKDLIISINNTPSELIKHELKLSFDTWKGELEQVDDVTIVGIRI